MSLSVEETHAIALTCVARAVGSYTDFYHPLLRDASSAEKVAVMEDTRRIAQEMVQQARITWLMVHKGEEMPRWP